jgi:hypothetical protein
MKRLQKGSAKKHATAKKENRLIKAGYGTKKGKFGFVLLGENKSKLRSKSRSRKHRGGGGEEGKGPHVSKHHNSGLPVHQPPVPPPAPPKKTTTN